MAGSAVSQDVDGSGVSPAVPDSYVLLIGVSEYPASSGLAALTCSGGDIDAMAAAVGNLVGFENPQLTIMFGPDVTKRNVLEQLQDIRAELSAHPERSALVYFTGHGMYLGDIEPYDEADGTDEAFIMADMPCLPARVTGEVAREHLLLDDEIYDYIAGLPDCRRFILIADACHSGGMAKDLGDGSPTVKGLGGPPSSDKGLVTSTSELLDIPHDDVIVILASQDGEEALVSNRHGNSVLTYALRTALVDDTTGCDLNADGVISIGELGAYLPLVVSLAVQDEYRGRSQQVQIGLAGSGSILDEELIPFARSKDTLVAKHEFKESAWTPLAIKYVADYLADAVIQTGLDTPDVTATVLHDGPYSSGDIVAWELELAKPAAIEVYHFDAKGDANRIPLDDREGAFDWSNVPAGRVFIPGGDEASAWPVTVERRGIEFIAVLLLPPGVSAKDYRQVHNALMPSGFKQAMLDGKRAGARGDTWDAGIITYPGLAILPFEVEP